MLNVQMLNAKCKMMYASIELSPFGIHGIRHLTFGIWHLAFGIRHLAFVIRHLAFGIRHLAFGIWHSLKDGQ